eukprot:6214274-Alexandrium_andersonii.AAC.1
MVSQEAISALGAWVVFALLVRISRERAEVQGLWRSITPCCGRWTSRMSASGPGPASSRAYWGLRGRKGR